MELVERSWWREAVGVELVVGPGQELAVSSGTRKHPVGVLQLSQGEGIVEAGHQALTQGCFTVPGWRGQATVWIWVLCRVPLISGLSPVALQAS